jgi:hypothetical protein
MQRFKPTVLVADFLSQGYETHQRGLFRRDAAVDVT